ncbi:hypothetical protein [Marinobacterium sp. BA1]|uniref:hypothetical protein n=1 Tax=Marinobacterium sp. BA1 TaxID=3138931 RepID=UPI0032E6AF79
MPTQDSLYIREREHWLELFVPNPSAKGKKTYRYIPIRNSDRQSAWDRAIHVRDQILQSDWGQVHDQLRSVHPSELPQEFTAACASLMQLSERYGQIRVSTLGFLGATKACQPFTADAIAEELDTAKRNLEGQLQRLAVNGFIRRESFVLSTYFLTAKADQLLAEWDSIRAAIHPDAPAFDAPAFYIECKQHHPSLMLSSVAYLLMLNAGTYNIRHLSNGLGTTRAGASMALQRLRAQGSVIFEHGGISGRPTELQHVMLTLAGHDILNLMFELEK